MIKKTFLLIIVITLIGGFLRFFKITENPPSLNGDEISMAYDAYSILKTGKDQFGKFMPITFKSVGDYKNAVPIYMMTLPIKIFGLNDFSVRFQNALFGTLMIPLFYLFLQKIIKDKTISLLGAFFLSISAWHIYYSRIEYETLIAALFVLLGIWSFIRMLEGGRKWPIISAFFLILTMYTAPAPRLFVPLFIICAFIINFIKHKNSRNNLLVFAATCGILVLPLIYATLFLGAGTRLSMVLISNDIEFQRYVLLKHLNSIFDFPLLLFFWLKRYLNYLQPEFVFINGLNMTLAGNFGLGVLYFFEVPWLILGIFEFIKRRLPHKEIFVIWLVTGIIPDSITNNQQHAGRLLHIAPVVFLITSLGAISFLKWVLSLSTKYLRISALSLYALFICIILANAFLVFSVHFPIAKGESYDEGLKEAVLYIEGHQKSYQEVIFDPRRGMEGPYLVSNPYLYVLFYTKYDPKTYQTETKILSKDSNYFFHFNKYTFRPIDWTKDSNKKDTLFIGSPWSLPEKELRDDEILKKIYLTNGNLAFLIVSPKPRPILLK